MRYLIFRYNLIAIPITACLTAVILWGLMFDFLALGSVVTVIGTLITFIYFAQKQDLEEARLFKELFTTFNQRYDGLNEVLNNIVRAENQEAKLTPDEEKKLDDYFNLCGEEYLFVKRKYIYPVVWKAWKTGMQKFLENPRIRQKWLKETKEGWSYYGLEKELK